MNALVLLLLTIISCKQSIPPRGTPEALEFEDKNFPQWQATTKIEMNDEWQSSMGAVIDRPPTTWTHLLRFEYRDAQRFATRVSCLYYRVPHQRVQLYFTQLKSMKPGTKPVLGPPWKDLELGELKVIDVPHEHKCTQSIGESSENTLKGITSFRMTLSESEKIRLKERFVLPPFHLLFQMEVWDESEQRSQKVNQLYPLLNLRAWKKEQRNLGPKEVAVLPRAHFFAMEDLRPKKNPVKDTRPAPQGHTAIGEYEDRYDLGKAILCHELDASCKEIKAYKCDQCRYGYYEVGGGLCPTVNNKFCGLDTCGQKGNPACPRGREYVSLYEQEPDITPTKTSCSPDDPNALCADGLLPSCNSDKILICL